MTSEFDPKNVLPLIQEVISAASELKEDSLQNEEHRVRTLEAARKLMLALEKPKDALIKHLFSPAQPMCTRIAVDLDLFNIIKKGDGPKTATELAELSGGDRLLIARIMRVLAALGFVVETGKETYAPSRLTETLTERTMVGMIRWMLVPSVFNSWMQFDHSVKSIASTPAFLRGNGFKTPNDQSNGAFQLAFQTKLQYFDWASSRPDVMADFNTFMEGDRGSRPDWVDWFPVQQQLLDGFKPEKDAVLLVDVAGGRGQDIALFKNKFPHAPGRLILQDLPKVIDDVQDLNKDIGRMKHDFFTPQPVGGARAYYMKFIMHDWSDEKCREILLHLAAAMTKGYSKLLIEEFILPDQGCPLLAAVWDIEMMAILSSMERTRDHWRELLDSAGLEIKDFRLPPGDGQGIVEAMLKD